MDDTPVQTLIDAVLCGVSPTSTPQQRASAYQVCEKFKQSSPETSGVLFEMLPAGRDDRLRHFALQVVDHVIRVRWYTLMLNSKQRLKEVCMALIVQMPATEPVYIREAIARCIVEIVKREWPQHWPTFVDDMSGICAQSKAERTDTVMRIFLRLAEDVVILNTVQPAQRRKEIQAALNEALLCIVPFLVTSLRGSLTVCSNGASDKEHMLTVAKSTLDTIMGYVGWCDAGLVTADDNLLIRILVEHLPDRQIRMHCVECLLVIAQRHGNVASLSPALALFNQNCLMGISQVIKESMNSTADTETHDFMKRICQTVTSMGELLCSLWSKEGSKFVAPVSLPDYIQIVSALTTHPSLFIFSSCYDIWSPLIRLSNEHSLGIPPNIVEPLCALSIQKLEKVGAYGETSHPSGYYATLDYDSMENWLDHFHRTRSSILTVLQHLWKCGSKYLLSLSALSITRLIDDTQSQYSGGNKPCDKVKCRVYIQWEAINSFLHALSRELTDHSLVQVFDLLLSTKIREPQLQSIILSVISALFHVIPALSQATFNLLIQKIYESIEFSDPSYSPSHCQDLSRHAGALFIKLTNLYASRLTDRFEELNEYALRCKRKMDVRSHRCLSEGLILISNEIKNFRVQTEYISGVLSECLGKWNDPILQSAIESPQDLARYIGLLSAPDPIYTKRRMELYELLKDMVMMPRRVTVPTDDSELALGGFVNEFGVIISPAGAVILPHLTRVLLLLHSTLGLFNAETVKMFHTSYPASTIHGVPYSERADLIGRHNVEDSQTEVKSEAEYVQRHVLGVIECITQLVLFLGRRCTGQFFRHPNIAAIISEIVVSHAQEVNALVFKNLLKTMVKPFCLTCPVELQANVVVPLLNSILPHIVSRLDTHWLQVKEARPTGNTSVDVNEDRPEDEIIEEELLRAASRELLDMCSNLILRPVDPKSNKQKVAEEANGDIQMAENGAPSTLLPGNEARLTDYAQGLAQEDISYLLWLSTTTSCWLDSLTALKSLDLVLPLIRCVHLSGCLTCEIVVQVVRSMLTSFHLLGSDDTLSARLLSTILSLYVTFRPLYPSVYDLFLHLPGVTKAELHNFEANIGLSPGANEKQRSFNQKKKKDYLRKLIGGIVRRDVSEHFKDVIVIKNLPPLVKNKLRKTRNIFDSNCDSESLGLCQMFTPT